MGTDRLWMSAKERERMIVMEQVESGGATLVEAASRLGVSYRQVKRIWRRWKDRRAGGLVHGLRGSVSNRRLAEEFKAQVLGLYRERYWDFGPTLAVEKLAEAHGLRLSDETLRRWLHREHLWIPRRAARVHRRRRPRRERFGALVQLDGSHHGWFEQRAPSSCLMVMVDDATGVTMAHMAAEETTRAAYEVLRRWIERYGLMSAIYTDKKSVFYTQRPPTQEEKRQGSGALTEFGRACWRLGIEMIWAHSPQAKGRVERKNGVLQDRLVKELRLRGIERIDQTNRMLASFCEDLNQRFARPPASPIDAHRHAPSPATLNDALCDEQPRIVQNDWTVRYANQTYQILPQPAMPQPGQRIIVRRRFDHTLAIVHRDQPLQFITDGAQDNKIVTPPLGAGAETHAILQRGHFYCGQKGDISTVA